MKLKSAFLTIIVTLALAFTVSARQIVVINQAVSANGRKTHGYGKTATLKVATSDTAFFVNTGSNAMSGLQTADFAPAQGDPTEFKTAYTSRVRSDSVVCYFWLKKFGADADSSIVGIQSRAFNDSVWVTASSTTTSNTGGSLTLTRVRVAMPFGWNEIYRPFLAMSANVTDTEGVSQLACSENK